MIRLLVATGNADKLREIRAILDLPGLVLDDLSSFPGVTTPEETGATFAANAREKALHYAAATGTLVVAEDSGLEVDALDGAPGVRSARFCGEQATYAERFDALYQLLGARAGAPRTARFVCALAVAAQGTVLFQTSQAVEGLVAEEPRGREGFGYDPIFYYAPFARTFGEVSQADKARVSHRGRAFRVLREYVARGALAATLP